MQRFLLTPRWWGINLFVLVSVSFCLFMGSWQLDRFAARVEAHEARERTEGVFPTGQATSSVDALVPVTTRTTGRLAVVTGRYDEQFLVPDRWLGDRRGFYVVTLLRPERGDAVPVVRGWLPGDAHGARVPAAPRGEVTVTGAVQPPETRGTRGAHEEGGLPAGRLGVLNAGSLVNLVPYPVHDAWLTLPDAPGDLRPVPPAGAPGTGLDLKAFQNLGYTGEWFAFAGFVVFMWSRFYRRESELHRARQGDAPVGTPRPVPAAAVATVRHDPTADARKDRVLKVSGAVLGAGLLALIVWSGTAYVAGEDVNSRLVAFDVVSDRAVEARIEVERASSASPVVCTLRSLAQTGQEAGRKDVRITESGRRVEARVTLRTAQRATSVELVGCR
ncbi:SURF1 family cytochrome oxidase biogenesis protein [Streptomyces sp. NPDC005931]|uniref:SURF1 family cytochrome oxidase biogenesis protein n=1 Tax=Streptomyces sp. NPDC005931 TaxID=3364737 RepID=UPI0036A714A8